MNDESTRAVTPIDGRKVQPIEAPVPQRQHERPNPQGPDPGPPAPLVEPDPPAVAVNAAGHRTTDLAYQVDAESKRVVVQVVDRETGEVIRSFPLFMPGQEARIDGEPASGMSEADARRGARVDVKA